MWLRGRPAPAFPAAASAAYSATLMHPVLPGTSICILSVSRARHLSVAPPLAPLVYFVACRIFDAAMQASEPPH